MSQNDVLTINRCRPKEQHVHEIVGSTFVAERCEDAHNHRFATLSGEAIPCKGSHIHNVTFRTDSYDGHYHEFSGQSSVAIPIADGKHVHYANDCTSVNDGHSHEFKLASLINNPIED